MNLQPNSELSIYQLIQELDSSFQPLVVSLATLKPLVAAFVDLLIEQKLIGQIWVKLTGTEGWIEEIERYQQNGFAEQIYLCSTLEQQPWFLFNQFTSQVIPMEMEASSKLNQESFLIALSPQFCGLIVAQQEKSHKNDLVKEITPPAFKLACTFNPEPIAKVLARIKQAIVEPPIEGSLSEENYPFSFTYSTEIASLSDLLLKLVQRTETLQSSYNKSAEEVGTPGSRSDSIPALSEPIRLQDEFLSYLVRELRPPLTKMKTALRLLESVQLKRHQRDRYLELLHRECDRQNSLITGLLELFQICNSVEPIAMQFSKLEELIPGIVSIYQPLANEKGIQLGYTIPSSFPPVSCPSNWLRQVLFILLNNSLKFTPPGGRVFVKAAWQNERIGIVVSDTGCGIEASEISKVFEPFFRGKAATNEEIIGAGLGLTIAKQLLIRCGGSISVTSKVGKGSAFRILLPVALH